MNLGDLEEKLFKTVNEQKRIADELLRAVNDRNDGRIQEQIKDSQASDARTRLVVIGVFAICAMVAFFFYKAKFGMF